MKTAEIIQLHKGKRPALAFFMSYSKLSDAHQAITTPTGWTIYVRVQRVLVEDLADILDESVSPSLPGENFMNGHWENEEDCNIH